MSLTNYKECLSGTLCRFMQAGQNIRRQKMSISKSSLDLYSRQFAHFLFSLPTFCTCVHLFGQPSSVFPAPLLCSGMCVSAGCDESVVNRVLLWACVCVFLFHVLHVTSQPRQDKRNASKKKKKKSLRLDTILTYFGGALC